MARAGSGSLAARGPSAGLRVVAKRASARRGVISPLLANIYMNRFLEYWRQHDLDRRLKARVVVYADDLVILTRGFAQEAHEVLRHVMGRIGLTVNETKTKLREARDQSGSTSWGIPSVPTGTAGPGSATSVRDLP